jgi:Cu(I)/Ag(I) efflux system periplasmic protein CusF
MKAFNIVTAGAVAMLVTGAALAQSGPSGPAMPQHGVTHDGTAQAPGQGQTAKGSGVVESVDAAKRRVNLSHGAIPAIGWPAMTMDFDVALDVNLSSIRAGQPVEFTLQGDGGGYTITGIGPREE